MHSVVPAPALEILVHREVMSCLFSVGAGKAVSKCAIISWQSNSTLEDVWLSDVIRVSRSYSLDRRYLCASRRH